MMIKKEGILSVYKGFSLPILTSIPKNATCFTVTSFL